MQTDLPTQTDTERHRATPEGVTLTLRVAGPAVRLLAWGIDAAVIMALQMTLAFFFGLLDAAGMGFYLLAAFLLTWFYPVVFEVLRGGATPGKKALGLQVIHDDGTPVGWAASLLRNLLLFADFLPLFFGAGLTSMLLHPDFTRLGDLAGGTLVIHRGETKSPAATLAPTLAPAVAPPVALGPEERQALIDYASRVRGWNEARSAELASVLEPLTGARDREGIRRLLGMASWLLGRQPDEAEGEAA